MPDPQNSLALNTLLLQPNILMAVRKPPVFTPVLTNAMLVNATATTVAVQPEPMMTAAAIATMTQTVAFVPPVKQQFFNRKDLVLSQIGETKLINPFLGSALAGIVPQTDGLPRERITVPISPQVNITDEQLFEGSVDTAARFFCPATGFRPKSCRAKTSFGWHWKKMATGVS